MHIFKETMDHLYHQSSPIFMSLFNLLNSNEWILGLLALLVLVEI